jgi:hydroxyacylglutathione hydrolase
MFFKQFLANDLGCASYLIGDTAAAICAVVDPRWNVTEYLDLAAEKGMRIAYVIETHNHADHVSGHGKLAQLGATVAIHESAGIEYPHRPLKDGESIDLGTVRVTVLHTPGHRPEHIALAITDTTRADEPWMVLTGDALFVGDVGRPDLAVEPHEGAAQLFRSLHEKLLTLPDGVELYPAHVAGSLCGKSMSDKPSSTIGFERRYNHPLTESNEDSFVRRVTSGLPPQPPQFASIVTRNRGPFLTEDPQVHPMTVEQVDSMRKEGALLLDTRSPEAFGGGHIPGAINVDMHGGQFATRASWVIPPNTPVLLVLETHDDLSTALESLAMAGQDNVGGYLLGGMPAWDASGRPLETIPQITAASLQDHLRAGDRTFQILDVRENSEWAEDKIPGALHIPFHQIIARLDEIPHTRPIATICGGGVRSSLAASLLKARGYEVANIAGGIDAWRSAGGLLQPS